MVMGMGAKYLASRGGLAGMGSKAGVASPFPLLSPARSRSRKQLKDKKLLVPLTALSFGITSMGPEEAEAMYVGAKPTDWGAFSSLADRMVRKEIPDVGKIAEKNLPASGFWKLGDLLKHDELYSQYPELKDIGVYSTPGKAGASFLHSSSTGPRIELGVPSSGKVTKTTNKDLLHEIQHAIQEKEGWARGGSPESMMMNRISDLSIKKQTLHDWEKGLFNLQEEIAANPKNAKLREMYQRVKGEYDRTLSEIQQLENPPKDVETMYRNLAGEIEARDTVARMGMSAAERQRIAPYSSENIPLKDWIVKGNKQILGDWEVRQLAGTATKKNVYKVYHEGKKTEKLFGSFLKARDYVNDQVVLRYGKPVVAASVLAMELARQGLSPQAVEAKRRKDLAERYEAGGLTEAINPVEFLIPARFGGGLVNMGIDAFMRQLGY